MKRRTVVKKTKHKKSIKSRSVTKKGVDKVNILGQSSKGIAARTIYPKTINSGVRLQVYLSRNGVCSRRDALDFVKDGHIEVNGKKVVEPSFMISPKKDKVFYDGQLVKEKAYDYIMLHKPKGYETTKSSQVGNKTVYDLLDRQLKHVSAVGRLDKATEGLLLLTNDGDTAYRMTHPKFGVGKTYFVKIRGQMRLTIKNKIERGVYVQGQRSAPSKIKNLKIGRVDSELLIEIHEGKKRQIRMMFANVGFKVYYLKRIKQGNLSLGSLKVGRCRKLSSKEIEWIRSI